MFSRRSSKDSKAAQDNKETKVERKPLKDGQAPTGGGGARPSSPSGSPLPGRSPEPSHRSSSDTTPLRAPSPKLGRNSLRKITAPSGVSGHNSLSVPSTSPKSSARASSARASKDSSAPASLRVSRSSSTLPPSPLTSERSECPQRSSVPSRRPPSLPVSRSSSTLPPSPPASERSERPQRTKLQTGSPNADRQNSTVEIIGPLSATSSVESFLAAGLLPGKIGQDQEQLLQVAPSELLGTVVEQLFRRRLRSCIIAFGDGQKEFFDCMDLNVYLLESIADGHSVEDAKVDWDSTKERLRRAAASPIQTALKLQQKSKDKGSNRPSSFHRFDSSDSLEKLIPLFRSYRRVPVFRGGVLSHVITASDILEMCCSLCEESKSILEETRLSDVILERPGLLSKQAVNEDSNMWDVMQTLRDENIRVAPVLEAGKPYDIDSPMKKATSSSKLVRNPSVFANGLADAHADGRKGLVGQFDAADLRKLFVRRKAANSGFEIWWWEDSSINTNLFFEPCMDFLSTANSLDVSMTSEAPYTSVASQETLARTISRTLASGHRNAVVTSKTALATAEGGGGGVTKALEGIVSALALVIAMLEVGLFRVLLFDPVQQKRTPISPESRRIDFRNPTLTRLDIEEAVRSEEHKGSQRVTFSHVIQLDQLAIPMCPQHDVHFMKFVTDDAGKAELDFRALKDLVCDTKALGSSAYCAACQATIGTVAPMKLHSPSHKTAGGFLGTLFGEGKKTLSCDNLGQYAGAIVLSGALKANTGQKKSKTAERLDQIRNIREEREASRPSSGIWSWFHFTSCCATCQNGLEGKERVGSAPSPNNYERVATSSKGDSKGPSPWMAKVPRSESEPISVSSASKKLKRRKSAGDVDDGD